MWSSQAHYSVKVLIWMWCRVTLIWSTMGRSEFDYFYIKIDRFNLTAVEKIRHEDTDFLVKKYVEIQECRKKLAASGFRFPGSLLKTVDSICDHWIPIFRSTRKSCIWLWFPNLPSKKVKSVGWSTHTDWICSFDGFSMHKIPNYSNRQARCVFMSNAQFIDCNCCHYSLLSECQICVMIDYNFIIISFLFVIINSYG